jgi:hypothetical protein
MSGIKRNLEHKAKEIAGNVSHFSHFGGTSSFALMMEGRGTFMGSRKSRLIYKHRKCQRKQLSPWLFPWALISFPRRYYLGILRASKYCNYPVFLK